MNFFFYQAGNEDSMKGKFLEMNTCISHHYANACGETN